MGELGAGVGGGGFAGVEDLGAEFGAGGAEEVGLVLDVASLLEEVLSSDKERVIDVTGRTRESEGRSDGRPRTASR